MASSTEQSGKKKGEGVPVAESTKGGKRKNGKRAQTQANNPEQGGIFFERRDFNNKKRRGGGEKKKIILDPKKKMAWAYGAGAGKRTGTKA